jgi:G:T-mismatch repair DNA endonuclease (very short patch repair protein)
MAGSGCFVCGAEKRSSSQVLNLEHFLARSRQEHGSRYDYSRAIYKGAKDKVEIICRKHGSFWQAAESHYTAGSGCPSCKSHYTKPQKEVEAFLKELGCEFAANTRSVISPRELDIYIPGHQLAIELNGTYWHSLTAKTIKFRRYRHRDKYRLCAEQGIQLLQIDEHEWRREVTRNIWKSIIASKLRKQTTVFARQTSFRSISLSEANVFLAIHHIQGATAPSRWCFGLFHKEVLVGVITFCEHQKTQLNLVRMAFAKNVTVVGGANKLFRNSLQHLPERDIVTFSNNRYSDGSVYGVLGFEKVANLSPSYQWFFKGKIWNKRHMRHKHLPVLLGEGYNPAETEQENMLRNGARCLYDAGYQKYVFRKIRTTRIHNESTSISEV